MSTVPYRKWKTRGMRQIHTDLTQYPRRQFCGLFFKQVIHLWHWVMREYSCKTQRVLRMYLGIQGVISEYSGSIQGVLREYLGNTKGVRYSGSNQGVLRAQGVLREYSGSTQGVIWEYSGSNQGVIWEYSGSNQGVLMKY